MRRPSQKVSLSHLSISARLAADTPQGREAWRQLLKTDDLDGWLAEARMLNEHAAMLERHGDIDAKAEVDAAGGGTLGGPA